MPSVDILVPFHPDSPQRQRIWDFNRSVWETRDVTVVVGKDPKVKRRPFSVARAINRAMEKSTADFVMVFGSDHVPPTDNGLSDIVDRASHSKGFGWAIAFDGTRFVTTAGTDAIIDRGAPTSAVHLRTRAPMATGPTMVRRDLFIETGGFDERFESWGWEDTAFRRVLHLMAGPSIRPPANFDLFSLHHPKGSRETTSVNGEIYQRDYASLTSETVRDFLAERGSYLSMPAPVAEPVVEDSPPSVVPGTEPVPDEVS